MKAEAKILTILLIISSLNLLSEAIIVPGGSYEYYKTYYRNTQFPRKEVESETLNTVVPCLTTFLQKNLPDFNRVSVYLPATHISPNTQYFLKELQSETTVLLLQGKFNIKRYYPALSIIILLNDISVIDKVNPNLISVCSRECIYVAIVTELYENKADFEEDAKLLVRLLSEKRIANVAIIFILGNSVQLVKSLSFKPFEILELSPPEFFGSCEETEGWKIEKDKIFSPLALNDGIANIAFFETEPFIMVNEDNQTVRGIEGDLLNSICSNLRLKLIADQIMWTSDTDDQYEIKTRLNSNQSYDMVLGALEWSPDSEIDYTFPYKVVRFVWLIPVVPNVSLRGLIAPFQDNVWYAVGAVLICSIVIKKFILHDISFLDVFAIIIGTSVPEQPEKLSSRIQFLSWALFGYVLSQSYLASLAGVLVEAANQQIETMEELVSTGIQYGGTKLLRELFATSDKKDDSSEDDLSDSSVIQTIYNNFVVMRRLEYRQNFRDLISGKNKNMALVAVLNISSGVSPFPKVHVQQLKEPLGIYPLAFAVRKGLPYLKQIDKKMQAIIEGGLVEYWDQRYIYSNLHPSGDDDSSDVLGITQLAPGFLLVVIGLLAGILALFIEIAVKNFRKSRLVKERVKKVASIWLRKARENKGKMKKKEKRQIKKPKTAKIAFDSKNESIKSEWNIFFPDGKDLQIKKSILGWKSQLLEQNFNSKDVPSGKNISLDKKFQVHGHNQIFPYTP